MVLMKLMALMKLMGLEKLIDGSDEICLMDLTNFSGSGCEKYGSEIVVVYHSTPFPCLGRRIFCVRKNCYL